MAVPVASIRKIDLREALYLPNLLTLSRLFLLPFIFFCLQKNTHTYTIAAIVLILVSILLDSLDGYVAHKRNQITNLGRILDPVVDKLSVGCGILFLLVLRNFPLWAALIIFVRDAVILLLVFVLIKKKAIITSSNFLGKATVTALAGMILFYIVDLHPHAAVSTYVAVFLVLLSGLDYIQSYLRIVKGFERVQSHE